MICRFINLDAAEARRVSLERAFSSVACGWTLGRIAAIPGAEAAHIPGCATAVEKACALSHRKAVEASLSDEGPSLIVEDDVIFSPRLPGVFRNASRALADWDVLLAECLIAEPSAMLRLAREYPDRAKADRFTALDLSALPFGGSTAYFVSPAGKRKLLDLLDPSRIDRAYDLALRDLAHGGRIRAFALFPFPVSLGPLSDASQMRERPVERILSTWRRAMFIDRDERALERSSAAIRAEADLNARLLGDVFAGMASQAFPSEV